MKLRTLSNRLLMIAAGVCAVAAPSYADWSPLSNWVRQNQSATCNHSHFNTTLGIFTHTRRARVRVTRIFEPVACDPVGPEIEGCVPVPAFHRDVATVTNEQLQADIILWGIDDNIPVNFLPFVATFNDVPFGRVKTLPPPPGGRFFTSLRAACNVSDNML
jgi:hypothetical protein